MNLFNFNSPIIIAYFCLSLVAWILNTTTQGESNLLFFSTYRCPPSPLAYVRLITHSIGHTNWNHFVGNFLYILLIGPMLEEKYGSINLLAMFVATSIFIGIYNSHFENYILCGASGNVYMLIVLSSLANITEGKIPITLILILLFYISVELKDEILGRNLKVYHLGHLLGALCGGVYGYIFWKHPTLVTDLLSLIQN